MTTTGIYTYDGIFSGNLGLVYSKPTDSIGYFNNSTPKTSSTGTGLVYGAIAVSSGGNNMITTLYGGNVLTSIDAGVTWTFRTAPGASLWRTAAISDNGSVMVVGSENGQVWTSTNSGVTWTNPINVTKITASIISPDGQTIWFAGKDGEYALYRSTNSGATFTNPRIQGNGGPVVGIAIVWNTPSTILVTTNGWMWRSVNSGASWVNIVAQVDWGNIVTTADGTTMAAAHPTDIRVSTDFGVTWIVKLSSQTSWKDVKVSSDGQKMVALSGNGHIWISTNAGTSWSQAQAYGPVKPITVTNSGSGAYLIDGVSNPTMSFIRGNTYTLSINASGHPFWIQTVPGAYSSGNIYSSGITLTSGTREIGTITFVVPINAPDTLYYVCQYHSSMQGSITITNSTGPGPGGSYAWYNAGVSSDLSTIVCLVWTSTGGNNIYSLWKTTNLGTTWTRFEVTLGGGYIRNMAASYDLKYVIMAVNGDYVYTSTNSGTTYTRQTSMGIGNWGNVATSQDGTVLAAVNINNSIWVSTNSGGTWQQTAAGQIYICRVSSTGQPMYYIYNTGQIYKSTDRGSTWSTMSNSPFVYWQSLSISSNGNILLGGTRGSSIFVSTDAGNTWTTVTGVTTGSRVRSTYMSSSGVYMIVGSDSGTWLSTNTGSTWRQLTNIPGPRCAISDNGQVIISVSTSGTVQISIDGGNTIRNTLTTSIQQSFDTGENDEGGLNISSDGSNFMCVARYNGYGSSGLPGFIWRNNQYIVPKDIGGYLQSYTTGTQLTTGITVLSTSFSPSNVTTTISLTGNLNWAQSLCMNETAKQLVVVNYSPGKMYISKNSGSTWSQVTSISGLWVSVANSRNGSIVIVLAQGGPLYISTDSTNTWREATNLPGGAASRKQCAISADGSIMIVASQGAYLYVSTDTGATWSYNTDTYTNWNTCAVSANGKILLAGRGHYQVSSGAIYKSTDNGINWSILKGQTALWENLRTSEDGTIITACINNYTGYISTDSGVTWTGNYSFPLGSYTISYDGKLVFVSNATGVSVTTNFGASFTTVYVRDSGGAISIASTPNASALLTFASGSAVALIKQENVDIGTIFNPYTSGPQRSIGLSSIQINNSIFGVNWTARLSDMTRKWNGAVAISNNGQNIFAVSANGSDNYAYISIDSGVTWTKITTLFNAGFSGAVVSSDFKNLAASSGSTIYTSNNQGITWKTNTIGSSSFFSLAGSNDGTVLIGPTNSSTVCVSTNFGVTWSSYILSDNLYCAASSSNGRQIVVAGSNSAIYISTNLGSNWTKLTNAPGGKAWRGITISDNGTRLVAAGDGLYTSTNAGVNWTQTKSGGNFQAASCSSDGKYIIAVPYGSNLYVSSDYGSTWTSRGISSSWSACAITRNGSTMVAGVDVGYIYTSYSGYYPDVGSLFQNL